MFKTIAVVAFSLLAATSALASEVSLYRAYDQTTIVVTSIDPSPAFMADGLAMERTSAAAALDASAFLVHGEEALATVTADLAFLTEPTATGSLDLMTWEVEEPALVQAYVGGRTAYEATLTP